MQMWFNDIKNPFGGLFFYKESTLTTMDDAREIANRGDFGSIALCDYQTDGRGRLEGRRWESSMGDSLMFSLVYARKELDPLLSLKAGLALSFTIEAIAVEQNIKPSVSIKWPNDVLVNGKKTAGILCKWNTRGAVSNSEKSFYCIVGMGINVKQLMFEDELQNKATSLYKEGIQIDRGPLLQRLLLQLHQVFQCPDFKTEYISELNNRLYNKGKKVLFSRGINEQDDELVTIKEVALDGGIVISTGNGLQTVYSGEFKVY